MQCEHGRERLLTLYNNVFGKSSATVGCIFTVPKTPLPPVTHISVCLSLTPLLM